MISQILFCFQHFYAVHVWMKRKVIFYSAVSQTYPVVLTWVGWPFQILQLILSQASLEGWQTSIHCLWVIKKLGHPGLPNFLLTLKRCMLGSPHKCCQPRIVRVLLIKSQHSQSRSCGLPHYCLTEVLSGSGLKVTAKVHVVT